MEAPVSDLAEKARKDSTMTTRRFVAVCVTIVLLASVAVVGYVVLSNDDGIVEGKVYGLAYTYKAVVKGSGLEGRVFDFADRNLPKPSLFAPDHDARGMALIRENTTLPPGTVRKMRIRVPAIKIEGVTYPAYEYLEWQYHLGTREPQSIVPVIIPSR